MYIMPGRAYAETLPDRVQRFPFHISFIARAAIGTYSMLRELPKILH